MATPRNWEQWTATQIEKINRADNPPGEAWSGFLYARKAMPKALEKQKHEISKEMTMALWDATCEFIVAIEAYDRFMAEVEAEAEAVDRPLIEE